MTDGSSSSGQAESIRAAVRAKYRVAADAPAGHFPYPVGRAGALGLGYDPAWLGAISEAVVERFVGVGNPFALTRPRPGAAVLDVGCGGGLDTFVAALLVGPGGRSVGIDLTPEMLTPARAASAGWRVGGVEFREAAAEELPFADGAFDLAISNGVLNLVFDKERAYSELFRVLKPGGTLAVADLLVVEEIPAAVLADVDAWST
ncbi:MAG: methyltransferase domain-containing protein [Planctomycetes bacterium]|nr:methyltransferase domain-containing protein [Planctomycetota bacterium]